jgi:filamentous hemagglutinin family protein
MLGRSWNVCVLSLGVGWLSMAQVSIAQNVIAPDTTLGNEASLVNSATAQVDLIEGGARRGQNLFHSFREFNIGSGREAYFVAPDLAVQNIFARVTGVSRSEILGVLGTTANVNGNFRVSPANLFLLNPNGILFGPNARLNLGASFTATTASGVRFRAVGNFDTIAPQSPGLLTVQPSAYLFGDRPAAKIEIESNQILNPNIPPVRGLAVPVGEKFTLLGGDIELRGGRVNALGGRLELGAIGGNSEVLLQDSGALTFPANGSFQDIKLTNRGAALTAWNGGGDIAIASRNLLLSGGSEIAAGIFPALGSADTQAGDINAKVTNSIVLEERSSLRNNVNLNSLGNAGNLVIETNNLTIQSGAISSSTFGRGDAGNLSVTVQERATLDGALSASTGIFSTVGLGAVGKGGQVLVKVGNLEMTNGAAINSGTSGQGNAGNLILTVRDKALLNGKASGVGSAVDVGAVGRGGQVLVEVGSLEITNGANINASTSGQGDAGNLTLTVRDKAVLAGTSPDGFPSSVASTVNPGSVGRGGQMLVKVGSLEITNGANINASTSGQGDAGSLTLTVRDKAVLAGTSPNGFSSSVSSTVNPKAVGKGGQVLVNVGSLEITNGARVETTVGGQGNAGNLTITVRDKAVLAGTSPDSSPSKIASIVTPEAVGNGGQVLVEVGSLEIINGAAIDSSTVGLGDAGDINITSQKEIVLIGSFNTLFNGIFAASGTQQATGDIIINTPVLRLDRSQISVGAISVNGGNIFIGALPNTPEFANAPTVQPTIVLRNGSLISSTAGNDENPGNGGNINIDSRFIIAIPKENSDISANAFKGNGGKININSKGVFGFLIANKATDKLTPKSDIIASSTEGVTGTISVTTPDNSAIQNNLSQLPINSINPDRLVSQTCLVRQNSTQGSFYVSNKTSLASSPGNAIPSTFATAKIQATKQQVSTDQPWKLGDPVIESTGFYRMADNTLVMGRECPKAQN